MHRSSSRHDVSLGSFIVFPVRHVFLTCSEVFRNMEAWVVRGILFMVCLLHALIDACAVQCDWFRLGGNQLSFFTRGGKKPGLYTFLY